jgi:hypothetical protein
MRHRLCRTFCTGMELHQSVLSLKHLQPICAHFQVSSQSSKRSLRRTPCALCITEVILAGLTRNAGMRLALSSHRAELR